MRNYTIFTLLIIVFIAPCMHLSGESMPLLIVADFEYTGISQEEMKLLVDLFSYTVFESGRYRVLSRYERNKLVKGFGYNQDILKELQAYLEIGELLHAEFLITGSCLFDNNSFSLVLNLWEIKGEKLKNKVEKIYKTFDDLINQSRLVTGQLIMSKNKNIIQSLSSGLSETLYVSLIQERVLVVFSGAYVTEKEAAFHFLVSQACTYLDRSKKMSFQFSSLSYDIDCPDLNVLRKQLKKRNCHTLALLVREEESYYFVFYDDNSIRLKILCSLSQNRTHEARRIAKEIENRMPLLTLHAVARELIREMTIKEKLDMLLFNERFLSQRYLLNVHYSFFKPAVVGKYHPLLNILSLEGDFYWYYTSLLGCGIGYAFSLAYPATIDSKLISHPLINQHEFRLIPLSFRSAGSFGIIADIISALTMQNAYRIYYDEANDTYEYLDETSLFSLKFSLHMGLMLNLEEDMSIFIDLATLSYIIPLNLGKVTYDGTCISGALGGIGVIFRF
jgi:hypothetical protein